MIYLDYLIATRGVYPRGCAVPHALKIICIFEYSDIFCELVVFENLSLINFRIKHYAQDSFISSSCFHGAGQRFGNIPAFQF